MATIRVSPSTRSRLARLKSSPRETYDELLRKLMALVPEGDEEGTYADAFRAGLLDAMRDVGEGRLVDHESVRKTLGL